MVTKSFCTSPSLYFECESLAKKKIKQQQQQQQQHKIKEVFGVTVIIIHYADYIG